MGAEYYRSLSEVQKTKSLKVFDSHLSDPDFFTKYGKAGLWFAYGYIGMSLLGMLLGYISIRNPWMLTGFPLLAILVALVAVKKLSLRRAIMINMLIPVVLIALIGVVEPNTEETYLLIVFGGLMLSTFLVGIRFTYVVALIALIMIGLRFYLQELQGVVEPDLEKAGLTASVVVNVLILLTLIANVVGSWIRTSNENEYRAINVQQRMNAIMSAAGEGMIATDGSGSITYVNEEAEQLFRVHSSRLLGQNIAQLELLFNDEHQPYMNQSHPVYGVIATQKDARYDLTTKENFFVRQNDEYIQVGLSINPIFSKSRQLIGTITVLKDITADAQFAQTKSEFVSLASHQLRTPVNSSKWYIEKLMNPKYGDLNEKQLGFLKEIQMGNQYIMSLITDLLNTSRAELGTINIKGEDVDPVEVLRGVHSAVQLSAENKNLSLTVSYDQQPVILRMSDKKLVEVMYENLFTNAIKYTAEGEVRVHLYMLQPGVAPRRFGARVVDAPNGGAVLVVQDTGMGIPKDQQGKIFQKLFRANNALTTNVDGTGLGMYLSRQFAQELGGDIWFESQEGVGSVFYVYLASMR